MIELAAISGSVRPLIRKRKTTGTVHAGWLRPARI
jgi:hypothetical protein